RPASVRQVFYRMTTLPVGVEKTEAGYRCVQRRLLALRRAGIVPYGWVSDNTRWRVKPESHGSLEAALARTQEHYRRALWDSQPVYLEIWCESDSIAGVIGTETHRWDVPLLAVHGFSSATSFCDAGQELAEAGNPGYVSSCGDYDPSGLLTPQKTEEGLRQFAPQAEIYFSRVAVTQEQIEVWGLPGRPPKPTD